MRIFRPSRLPPPAAAVRPIRPDHGPAAIRGSGTQPSARARVAAPRAGALAPRDRRDVTLKSHPFAMAIAVGLVGMTMATVVDQTRCGTCSIFAESRRRRRRCSTAILSDAVWRSARPITVLTNQGANFDGTGSSEVEIRAVHDGEIAYFSFVWSDPTRSLKHLPLIKKADGWHVVQSRYDVGDENEFHEDKFSVLLARSGSLLGGDRGFHAGRAPIAGKPRDVLRAWPALHEQRRHR